MNRILRSDGGFGAMELALVLPILMLLLLGMVDVSRMVATKIDLEQASQRATDFALAKRPSSSDASYLVAEAAAAANVSPDKVSVTLFLTCNGTRQANFDSVCTSGQSPARFAEIAITDSVDTQFNWNGLAFLFGGQVLQNSINVTGDSTVRFQ